MLFLSIWSLNSLLADCVQLSDGRMSGGQTDQSLCVFASFSPIHQRSNKWQTVLAEAIPVGYWFADGLGGKKEAAD